MNLAQLIQSQNLARLLQALDAAGELTAGTTVRARLLSLDPDGTATAAIGDAKIALVLAGPQAKQAALQPGATLVLHLEAPEQPGGDLRATLLDIRQPGGPPAAGAPTGAQLPPTAQAPASTLPPSGGLAAPSLPAPAGDTASATASHPLAQPPAQAATSLPSATVVPSEHLSRLATEIASGRAPLPTIAQKPGSAGSLEHPEALSKAAAPPAPARAVVPGEVGQATLPPPVSPRAAIGPTLGEALMRQDSLAPLFANLRGLAEGTVALTLPKPLLGAIDQSVLVRLLDALKDESRTDLLAIADEMAERSFSFAAGLQDLGSLLHKIALAQYAPQAVSDDWPEAADVRRLAEALSPEAVQLYYQIATRARGELGLAPDEYTGFSMALLRMAAFTPLLAGGTLAEPPMPQAAGAARAAAPSTGAPGRG